MSQQGDYLDPRPGGLKVKIVSSVSLSFLLPPPFFVPSLLNIIKDLSRPVRHEILMLTPCIMRLIIRNIHARGFSLVWILTKTKTNLNLSSPRKSWMPI